MLESTVLPPILREELSVVTAIGLYEDEGTFLADAVRTFLAARPDLREAIACKLYEWGDVSLGRAAEWSGLSIEAMKEALHRRGIVRRAEESPSETAAMAHETLRDAGKTVP